MVPASARPTTFTTFTRATTWPWRFTTPTDWCRAGPARMPRTSRTVTSTVKRPMRYWRSKVRPGVLWGLGDREGTIRDVASNSGSVLEHRTFDSFGKPTSTWAADYLFGLDGMPYDPPSGTYTPDNSRLYDPATGRFLSEDPTVPRPDQNLYRWCGNNALNETDPSGRCG